MSLFSSSSLRSPFIVLLFLSLLLLPFPSQSLPTSRTRLSRRQSPPPPDATNTNSSSLVCTSPTNCSPGDNSLTAGVHLTLPPSPNTNITSLTLLPGSFPLTGSGAPSFLTPFLGSNPAAEIRLSDGFSLLGDGGKNITDLGNAGGNGGVMTVNFETGLTLYDSPLFEGKATFLPPSTNTSNSTTTPDNGVTINSILIANGMRAILDVSGNNNNDGLKGRVVVWEGTSDLGQWSRNVGIGDGGKGIKIVDLQSSTCKTECSSGGICNPDGGCDCKDGFTGPTCDTCTPLHFGPSCLPCPACPTGTTCSDSLSGSGTCLPSGPQLNSTDLSLKTCNCKNGVCQDGGVCACNAGFEDAPGGGQKCAQCQEGYFDDGKGNCLACTAGCTSCATGTGLCQTCDQGLEISSSTPNTCVPSPFLQPGSTTAFSSCSEGTFFSNTTQGQPPGCQPCDPVCDTCFGPGPGSCLKCKAPRGLIEGVCTDVDKGTGVCDKSVLAQGGRTIGSNANWVFDNQKGICDALPSTCASGQIPNFAPTSPRSALQCQSCLEGSFLSNGACVETCPTGTFAPQNTPPPPPSPAPAAPAPPAANAAVLNNDTSPAPSPSSSLGIRAAPGDAGSTAACTDCDPSCGTCEGTATTCTSCKDPTKLLLNGTCVSGPNCPNGFFKSSQNLNGNNVNICQACHPDCETCSGTDSNQCLTCKNDRPVLTQANTCVLTCAQNEFLDTSGGGNGKCTPCDGSCTSCSGGGNNQCLSCDSTHILKGGSCQQPSNCATNDGKVIDGFGICLESLVTTQAQVTTNNTKKSKTAIPLWAILVIVFGTLAILAAAFFLYRRRNQIKRRMKTNKFADKVETKRIISRWRWIRYPFGNGSSGVSSGAKAAAAGPVPPPSPSTPESPVAMRNRGKDLEEARTPAVPPMEEVPITPPIWPRYAPSQQPRRFSSDNFHAATTPPHSRSNSRGLAIRPPPLPPLSNYSQRSVHLNEHHPRHHHDSWGSDRSSCSICSQCGHHSHVGSCVATTGGGSKNPFRR